jgi:hypothetical protein
MQMYVLSSRLRARERTDDYLLPSTETVPDEYCERDSPLHTFVVSGFAAPFFRAVIIPPPPPSQLPPLHQRERGEFLHFSLPEVQPVGEKKYAHRSGAEILPSLAPPTLTTNPDARRVRRAARQGEETESPQSVRAVPHTFGAAS